MKKIYFMLSILMIAISISSYSQEVTYHKGKIVVLDSIYINDDSVLVNLHDMITNNISNNRISIQTPTSDKSIAIFDEKGFLKYNYGTRPTVRRKVPNNPVGMSTIKDTVYVLYRDFNVYVFYKDQKIRKVQLSVPKKHTIISGKSFVYIPSTQQFVITQGRFYKKNKKMFSKANLLSFFDAKTGEFIKQSGTYPKELFENERKRFGLRRYYQYLHLQEGKLLVSFPKFPYIEEYALDGSFIKRTCQIPPKVKRITKTKRKEVEASTTYIGPTAKVLSKNIYYHTYKKKQDSRSYFSKYNEETKEYIEVVNSGRFPGMVSMLPNATEDYFYFIVSFRNATVYKARIVR